jgi:hypothetical protein
VRRCPLPSCSTRACLMLCAHCISHMPQAQTALSARSSILRVASSSGQDMAADLSHLQQERHGASPLRIKMQRKRHGAGTPPTPAAPIPPATSATSSCAHGTAAQLVGVPVAYCLCACSGADLWFCCCSMMQGQLVHVVAWLTWLLLLCAGLWSSHWRLHQTSRRSLWLGELVCYVAKPVLYPHIPAVYYTPHM